MYNVVIVGFGGIAKAYRMTYGAPMQQGLPVYLKAVCDTSPDRFTQSV